MLQSIKKEVVKMDCPIDKNQNECPCPEYSKEGLCDYPYRNSYGAILENRLAILESKVKGIELELLLGEKKCQP